MYSKNSNTTNYSHITRSRAHLLRLVSTRKIYGTVRDIVNQTSLSEISNHSAYQFWNFFICEFCVAIIFKQYTRRISVLLFFDILSQVVTLIASTLNLFF